MKKRSISLTVRIFLMTSALILFACAITYGAIAYLTPITYTSILEDELDRKVRELVNALEMIASEDSEALLDDFERDTGAKLTVRYERDVTLYNNIAVSGSTAYEAGEAAQSEPVASAGSDVVMIEGPAAQSHAVSTSESMDIILPAEDTMFIAGSSEVENIHSLVFADGAKAWMSVTGGVRAVNQAAEALWRVLPFLVGVILLISLVGAFFYARYITRPIVSISRIARRIAALDFDARWKRRRSDEIGALGQSLNLLSDNLSDALNRLKDANQALQRDIDCERELDRQRLAFFSAASHELKTPVTILKGQLSGMLAQVGIYRDREKYLSRALEVTGRMESLVQEILTISRIESGSFSLKRKTVDLADLVRTQLELDRELFEQKGLSLETHVEAGVTVQGDEALLAKAIDNVLINAILYSLSGACIRVEVEDHVFSVENTGASIPEAMLSQLFTPFYRVEQSRNRKSGGSGLGLYLVKTILDRHSISCGIENTLRGVRFTAHL